ncbi:MAG: hypothetical protein ACRC3H_06720 [Lachnospiraceae bacterium]
MRVKELKKYPNIYGLMSHKIMTLKIFTVFSFFIIFLCLFIVAALLAVTITFTSIIFVILGLILISIYIYTLIYNYLSYKKLNDKCLQLVDYEVSEGVIFNAAPYQAVLTKSFLILHKGAGIEIISVSDLIKLGIGYTRKSAIPYLRVIGKNKKSSYKQTIGFVNKQVRNNIDLIIKKTNEQISINLLENV